MTIDYKAPILVVDDDPTMRDLVAVILKRTGFKEVDQSSDGLEALAMARCRDYQIVISDLHMQAGGGLDLLRAMQADKELKGTPFLLMTGSVGAGVAASLCGADGHIMKPFTPDQLRDRITAIFGRRNKAA